MKRSDDFVHVRTCEVIVAIFLHYNQLNSVVA